MWIDPNVERRKFAEEVAVLSGNEARLLALGAVVLRTNRPVIDVLFVPHHPLQLILPIPGIVQQGPPASGRDTGASQQGSTALAPERGSERPPPVAQPQVTLLTVNYPMLSARPFGIRFDLSGYDQRAPAMSFRDPLTWRPLLSGELPKGMIVDEGQQPRVVVIDGHPATGMPFVCIRGVREYHEHPQHDGDDWAQYRGSLNLYAIIERLARIMVGSVQPRLVPPLPAQLSWALQGES